MERRALKVLSEKRLVKVIVEEYGLELYIAYSAKRERAHLVLPEGFCTCSYFYFNVFSRRVKDACLHLKALELSQSALPEVKLSVDKFKKSVFPLIFKGLLA